MDIGLLVGSLGDRSANGAAVEVVARYLAPRGIATHRITGLAALPPFRPDQADDPPAPVADFRSQLAVVDAVVLAAPEYAGGVAGSAKNALDWLVGDGTLYHKLMAVLSVGTSGGPFAIEQLVRTLSWQGALVVSTLGIAAPMTKMGADGHFHDQPTIDGIEALAQHLVATHAGTADDRLAAVGAIVTPYGIDPARFGTLA